MTAALLLRLVLRRGACPLVLVAVWWFASDGSTDVYWPPLRTILDASRTSGRRDRLRADVLPSLLRLPAGYALAAVVGVALGMVIGSYRAGAGAAASRSWSSSGPSRRRCWCRSSCCSRASATR